MQLRSPLGPSQDLVHFLFAVPARGDCVGAFPAHGFNHIQLLLEHGPVPSTRDHHVHKQLSARAPLLPLLNNLLAHIAPSCLGLWRAEPSEAGFAARSFFLFLRACAPIKTSVRHLTAVNAQLRTQVRSLERTHKSRTCIHGVYG